ncbi:MAG: hypothetical protein ABIT08_13565 [Bacteroidia bacterium]
MKEISYQKFLDNNESERLRIRIKTEKGKVIDLVVQYESYLNNKWTPIVRYDCAHGFFHRDILFNGKKEKQTITITSLVDALNYAEQDIKDRWEFYKERFLKKNKK